MKHFTDLTSDQIAELARLRDRNPYAYVYGATKGDAWQCAATDNLHKAERLASEGWSVFCLGDIPKPGNPRTLPPLGGVAL